MMIENCFAKINLNLRILGKRGDGFHEIESVFQEIDLHDRLSWQAGPQPFELKIHGSLPGDPRDNLILKAAVSFREASGIPVGGRFRIEKRIPVGSGLGGGSADAAAVLRLLNRHFDQTLNPEQLLVLATDLGSDVPFFLAGGRQLARGRGEVLGAAPPVSGPERGFLLIPPLSLATGSVFRAYSPLAETTPCEEVFPLGKNDLLAAAKKVSAVFSRIWDGLEPLFAADGCFFMTGSGSCLVWLTAKSEPGPAQLDALQKYSVGLRPFQFMQKRDAGTLVQGSK